LSVTLGDMTEHLQWLELVYPAPWEPSRLSPPRRTDH
jgi:hypothetical protein